MNDLTKGNPLKVMLSFALPVALGSLFQIFYSLADMRIVGSTLGETPLAAVSATTSLYNLMIQFMAGLANGFAILIAQAFGAGKQRQLHRYAGGSLALGFAAAEAVSIVSLLLLPKLLSLLKVSEELMPMSVSYIRILLAGMAVTMLYNGIAGILRAVGDTRAPLGFLIFSSILNIFLDLFFIRTLNLGVSGAAMATVLSQMVSVVLSAVYMTVRYPIFRFLPVSGMPSRQSFLSLSEIRSLYSSGFSMALMMSFTYFGTLSLQTAINTFGNDTIVAHAAARKMTEIYMLAFNCMGTTMSTFCGQNKGAGRMDRIRIGLKDALLIVWGWSLLVMLITYLAAPQLIGAVTGSTSEAIRSTGALYLKVNTVFYFVPAAIAVLRTALQGMGEKIIPVFSSFLELCGKVMIAFGLAPLIGYWGIILAEPIIWHIMVIPLILRCRRCISGEKRIA